jgi:sn1-specific diacylglycerol lipase
LNVSKYPNTLEDLDDLNQLIDDLLEEQETTPSPDTTTTTTLYQRQLQAFLQVQEQRKESRGTSRRLKLYPPGRMIHLLKTGEKGGCVHVMCKFNGS